jgi:hypothetical protein
MKTRVIIVDNQNLSNEDFEFLSQPIALQFKDASVVKLNGNNTGWLGRELRTALDECDEVLCVPINALEVDVPAIRAVSIANNAPLVVSEFETGPGGFFAINKYFVYIDLSFFRANSINMDWGPEWVSENAIGYPTTTLTGNILEKTGSTEYSTSFGPGWIVLSSVLNANGRVLKYPVELLDNIASVADSAIRQTAPCAAVDRWMQFVQDTRPSYNGTIPSPESIVSAFSNTATPVENLYTTADSLDAFKVPLSVSREFRAVFFSNSPENIEHIKTIVANWTGTNQAELAVPPHYQTALGEINYSVWQSMTQGYVAYFVFDSAELIEDLETQRHVNNFIFLGNYSLSVRSFIFAGTTLASTEICHQNTTGYYIENKFSTGPYQQDLYKRFRITYRNTQTGFELPTEYDIMPHFLAQKWARAMRHDYLDVETYKVEKNYMLQHWEYDEANINGRSLTQLCSEMNRYVAYINAYFDGSSERRVPYQITQYFDPATVDQQILNEIHHHFELLIGQVWSVSEYYKLADGGTCFAIRQLNNLCHEMESLLRPSFRNSTWWSAGVYFPSLRVTRYKFIDSDYDHFSQVQNFGDLILHYSQLGKTPMEAFAANDSEVFDDNITGLRYLSGEFDISFRTDTPLAIQQNTIAKHNARAFPWIRSRGQDPESKYTGIGFVKVADFDRSLFPGMTAEQIMGELVKCDDIYKLELIDGEGNVVKEAVLDYTWRDILVLTDPTLPNYTGEFHW